MPAHHFAERTAGTICRPRRSPSNLNFAADAQGWFAGTFWLQIPIVMIIIAFGHSLLSMSGFETLAQVYREIAYPKLKNLRITANIVCWYAVICTGVVTVFAGMIIPDAERAKYFDNLIGGLAMNLSGPYLLRLGFHIFVVIVGGLILAGAVNTSIIGANGVLNRVAEDGVLLPWFRKPHRKFGTTSRIINLIAILQIATIIGSRGDMTILAEAYAFGVVWSFFMKALGVMVLRFQRTRSGIQIPVQLPYCAAAKFPIGLGLTTAGAGFRGDRESVLETDRDQVRRGVHHRVLPDLHDLRTDQPAPQARGEERAWSSSIWIIRRR